MISLACTLMHSWLAIILTSWGPATWNTKIMKTHDELKSKLPPESKLCLNAVLLSHHGHNLLCPDSRTFWTTFWNLISSSILKLFHNFFLWLKLSYFFLIMSICQSEQNFEYFPSAYFIFNNSVTSLSNLDLLNGLSGYILKAAISFSISKTSSKRPFTN